MVAIVKRVEQGKHGQPFIKYTWMTHLFENGRLYGEMDLSSASASYTGISAGIAHTVPNLIFRNHVGGLRLTDMKGAKISGRDRVDGYGS
jgi:hypothetical protein